MKSWVTVAILCALVAGLILLGALLLLTTEAEFAGFASLLLAVIVIPFVILIAPSRRTADLPPAGQRSGTGRWVLAAMVWLVAGGLVAVGIVLLVTSPLEFLGWMSLGMGVTLFVVGMEIAPTAVAQGTPGDRRSERHAPARESRESGGARSV